MRKTYKYRIYPTKETEQKLYWTLTRCRELYNAALSERKDAYKYAGKSISYSDQQNDLPEIKSEIREEYQDIAAHVLQDVLRRLSKAFDAFFRRCKNGEHPGYPRFQGRNRYVSFTYPDGAGWKFDGQCLHLAKIGKARVRLHRPLEGKIKTVTIKREVNEWYVAFSCEVDVPEKLPLSSEDVGIDLGVTHLATLSNGQMIEHPRYYRKAQKTLEKRQQALSRKKRGSHRRDKARQLVAKTHRTIARQRKDFQHKESRKLVEHYQVMVFEDIKSGNLIRKPKPKQDETGKYLPNGASAKGGLNKSILDAGWGTFVQLCSSKAAWAGRTLIKVDPKFTSQVCSQCGTVRKKDLSERWHRCDCGAELDRDVNAAINILERGRRQQGAISVEAPCL
ncbi:MAG: transposase [Ktedonobacter sp. 13_2_20CM_2_54_8]|nr:MAG: transposase [Ktedonobacter sp. 13_2_20CM_53_11]OLB60482.1 MAG: transposase [Ktedonobacter sp. 13_2_20CM_2_54_8]